jgi:hypothetical protein
MKRAIGAGLAIFAAWAVLDYFLHGPLLGPAYEASAGLWRPTDQMSTPLIVCVTVVLIACFVLIYQLLVTKKSLVSGILFGVLYGLTTGVASGFGSYIHMPLPLVLAWGWFLGGCVKGIAAGAIVGALIRE